MKMLVLRLSIAFMFFAAATAAVANPFRSKIITGSDSALLITVPEDHFLKITNFTQVGGTDRGVVAVTLTGEDGGSANVLTATRIDLSTGSNSQSFPEIGNRVIIAGPASVTWKTFTPCAFAAIFSGSFGFKPPPPPIGNHGKNPSFSFWQYTRTSSDLRSSML